MEAVHEVQLTRARSFLRKESRNRAVVDDGDTIFNCLAVIFKNIILRIPHEHATKVGNYANAEYIEEYVAILLSEHEKRLKSIFILLVDDIPPEALLNSAPESKRSKSNLDNFYQKVVNDFGNDKHYQYRMNLYLYAAATCINTPLYILCADDTGKMKWTFYQPLFNYEGQPSSVIEYVTMFMSSDCVFHAINAHETPAAKPIARGLVGMYFSILEDIPETSINVPENLHNLPKASKSKLCQRVSEDIVKKCCELFKEKALVNEMEYGKMTAHKAKKEHFKKYVEDTKDAFDIVCKVLLKSKERTVLKDFIENWNDLVSSCDFLAKSDALMELDEAIFERNIAVTALVNSSKILGQELDDRRKQVTKVVIGTSAVGIASGGMVIAGLILAPFSFGASLGLSIAGGVIGAGTGITSGGFRTHEAISQNTKLKDIKMKQEQIQVKERRLSDALEKVEKYFSSRGDPSRSMDTDGPGISLRGFLAIGSALKASHSIAGIALAAVKLGATAATVAASVLGPLSLALDIAFLTEAAYNKHKGDKTNAGELLQQMAETVHIKYKVFNSMLRGNHEEEERLFK